MEKKILDVSCGPRMFWFQKDNPEAVFMDNRAVDTSLCDGRQLTIRPDIVGDFREIPFADSTFYMVVFDPPHLLHAGEKSWLGLKYGILQSTWRDDLKKGFDECMRVLKENGVLVFKWNEEQIPLKEILSAIECQPLFGDKRSKTYWLIFMKGVTKCTQKRN